MPRTHIKREISRKHALGSDGKSYMLVEMVVVIAASFTVDEPHPPAVETKRFELADGSLVDAQGDGVYVVRSTGVSLRCRESAA